MMMGRIEMTRPGVGSDRVVYVDSRQVAWADRWPATFGHDRLAASDAACAAILANATPPGSCGPVIPVAPGRGPMLAFTPRRMDRTETGGFVRRHDGANGWDAARVADAFDTMEAQAARRHAGVVRQAEKEGRDAPAFVAPFTKGQVEVAREYAALVERCASSGVKCSSLEAVRHQGTGGDREAAVLRDFDRLRTFQRRIGDGLVKEVRRIRPGGRKRHAIRARYLVDQVCLGGRSLTEVLEACGWGVNEKSREGLRKGLSAALERMRGFDLQKGA